MTTQHPEFVLTLSCADRPGIVSAVSTVLSEAGHTITESQQFGDPDTERFFLRMRFRPLDGAGDDGVLRKRFAAAAESLGVTSWELHDAHQKMRVLLMASRQGHCLMDILFRARTGELPVLVVGVVSNHRTWENEVGRYGVPFHHVPVTPETKGEAERELLRVADEHSAELVVLARYMQILSDDACRALEGRAINIHHSLLPSFKGARPYHQAHQRGVKVIGATAHYVTADLDEGPIIEQDFRRVDHRAPASRLTSLGQDMEARALSRAVELHAEHRVLLNGTRTVVFD